MESAEELRKKAVAVQAMIDKDESALNADPDNFAYKLSLKSSKEHLADLLGQIGVALLNAGNIADAERELQKAIELKPATRGIFLNSILSNAGDDWATAIPYLRLLVRIAPSYENARNNLAIAFLNLGVEIAKKGKPEDGSIQEANQHFYLAMGAAKDPELMSHIRKNFAASYTKLAIYSHNRDDVSNTLGWMKRACEVYPDETTRRNLGVAYAHLSRALMNERRYDAAISQLECAFDTGVVIAELLNDYGVARAAIGHIPEAKLAFERVLELEPDNRMAKENLSAVTERETSTLTSIPESLTGPKLIEGKSEKTVWGREIEAEDLQIETLLPDFIPIPLTSFQYQAAFA